LATAAAAAAAAAAPPKAKTTMADNFPWRDPFTAAAAAAYEAACEATATFPAAQYTLHDLSDGPPTGLSQYAGGLRALFSGREYPGGWAGLDRHMHDRNLLVMEYADVPPRARAWIEAQERAGGEGRGLFALFDKPASAAGGGAPAARPVVVPPEGEGDVDRALDGGRVAIFAPGALYHVLPLFVADGSDCQGTDRVSPYALADLANYKAAPEDGAVVAWPVSHSRPDLANDKRDIRFTVKAQVLKRREGASSASDDEDEA
ncbi:hypothetical protein LX36DRAFT_529425, partial [Colletotrichum falcatum]